MTLAAGLAVTQETFWRPSATLRVAPTPTPYRRLAAALLAAICASALILAAAPIAAAVTGRVSETAVAAQTDTASTFVAVQTATDPAAVGEKVSAGYGGVLGCCVAPNTRAIGFAPGDGVSALTPNRLQHGTQHLVDAGVLPAWRGSTSPQLIRDTLAPILERPLATFDNTLSGTAVKGFIGEVNGQVVAVQFFREGPYAGQLATSVIPTPNQLVKWGVGP